ncbi:MAG TPA: response regulator transcription factor [Armatimonadota bacterium]|jgi:DNA-binding NarL/FixJ family response regulator
MDSDSLTGSPPIRILLVDDHPAIRQGLALFLALEGIVCVEASGRIEALAQVEERCPCLAIVDLSLDGEDGMALIFDLHERHVPVLVYSMHSDARRVKSAFAAGALGYATKREFDSVLVQGIREVAAGHMFVSPKAAAALAESLTGSPADDALQKLSPHERKVYELLGHGEDTFDIAAALHISNRTVESYYARMQVKLSLNGMHDLRRHAIEHHQQHTP